MNRRIRLCYVLNAYGIGGAETVALDLARRHDPARYDVRVLAALEPSGTDEPEMRRRFREAGVPTDALVQSDFRSPLAWWRLYRYFRRHRFDIVHAHNRPSDYWSLRAAAWAGVPHRFWTRHLVYNDMTPRQVARYEKLSGQVEHVLAVSDAVRRACLDIERIQGDRVTTVVNGIDTDKYRPLAPDARAAVRAEFAPAPQERLLLFVGRINAQKTPDAFVRLIWTLRAAGRPVRGLLCGRGPLDAEIRALIDGGPGGVDMLGLRNDVPALLGACDLFVSTSRNEGLPLNVMEAMSAGAPLVAPAIDQIACLMAGRPALERQLYAAPPPDAPPSDQTVAAWAQRIGETLDDPARLAAVGAAGREAILADYSLERMIAAYEGLHAAALARR